MISYNDKIRVFADANPWDFNLAKNVIAAHPGVTVFICCGDVSQGKFGSNIFNIFQENGFFKYTIEFAFGWVPGKVSGIPYIDDTSVPPIIKWYGRVPTVTDIQEALTFATKN